MYNYYKYWKWKAISVNKQCQQQCHSLVISYDCQFIWQKKDKKESKVWKREIYTFGKVLGDLGEEGAI